MRTALRIVIGIVAGALLATLPVLHFRSGHAHDAQGGFHASHTH
jgi:hypothetical protein